jgi:hypothetical protein
MTESNQSPQMVMERHRYANPVKEQIFEQPFAKEIRLTAHAQSQLTNLTNRQIPAHLAIRHLLPVWADSSHSIFMEAVLHHRC